jgi:hypothetical protein
VAPDQQANIHFATERRIRINFSCLISGTVYFKSTYIQNIKVFAHSSIVVKTLCYKPEGCGFEAR